MLLSKNAKIYKRKDERKELAKHNKQPLRSFAMPKKKKGKESSEKPKRKTLTTASWRRPSSVTRKIEILLRPKETMQLPRKEKMKS